MIKHRNKLVLSYKKPQMQENGQQQIPNNRLNLSAVMWILFSCHIGKIAKPRKDKYAQNFLSGNE